MGLFNFLSGKKKNKVPFGDALENVEVQEGLILPKAFANHWEEIKATALDYVEIIATPADKFTATESSFGSIPFFPTGFDYPMDGQGQPMIPLAQLNFAEMPAIEGYPTKGIVQFYIANTDTYGLDFDNHYNPDSFRVIYIEHPENMTVNPHTSFLDNVMKSEYSPVYKPHKLSFARKREYVGISDYRYNLHGFSIDSWYAGYSEEERNSLEDESYELFNTTGHKVGGYANFAQEDPREYIKSGRHGYHKRFRGYFVPKMGNNQCWWWLLYYCK
ncbi:MAG: DUF1963 domain-containing protein [Chitinophagaceae bacterium]|nr:MAG: DUF1963 domain-containing protein [Chitinophagaceae bacterium]